MLRLLTAISLAALLALAGTASADAHVEANGYAIEVTITDISIVGLVSGGMRADASWVGTVTEGFFAGSAVTGIDYNLMRPDGTLVIDVRMSIATPYGVSVAARIQGYWVPTVEMPPLEAFLDPDFEFPDIDIPGHAVVWHETMLPQYAHLNHTLFVFYGIINLARSEARWTVRPLTE